ncbi:MAG: hypothetical protein KBD83_04060 [Gammaproteobacteria bacterium]|nr:hypothetical protein [Gammaproteobacteria bacterium]
MYEIFNEKLIKECRDAINVYNAHRSGVGTVFARGAFRRLPELDNLLANASTAQHCAYILIYIYNAMSAHNTDKFYELAKSLRKNICNHLQTKFESAVYQDLLNIISVFKVAVVAQNKASRSHIKNEFSIEKTVSEKAARVIAYIDALDVVAHNLLNYKTTVCIDLSATILKIDDVNKLEGCEVALFECIQCPPNCMVVVSKKSGGSCTIS